MPSPFTPNTEAHRKKMLDAIGMDSVEGLFSDIPEEVRNPDLNLPKAMSELDLRAYASELSAKMFLLVSTPPFWGQVPTGITFLRWCLALLAEANL